MKKLLFILLLLSCISTLSYSQSKTEFGVTTEGFWFMPQQTQTTIRDFSPKSSFGTGIGIYVSRNIFWRFSADLGLSYRYKQIQQYYIVYNNNQNGGAYNPYGYGYGSDYIEGWDKLPMHYIVVPVHLQFLISKSIFVKGGIETTWLTNYEAVNEKPEFNWTLGFGSQKHKLKWSVNYIKGFKDQGFGDRTMKADGHFLGSINRNQMLQLNLSYPIWQK